MLQEENKDVRKGESGNKESCDDVKEHGNEGAVKAAGKYVQKGKTYEMVDGDIAYWKCGG